MSRPSDRKELTLFSKPPLLITESEEEFASLSAALEQAIKPRCVVERIYVADIADLVWEILRLRRCKAAIINTAFEDALSDLLNRLMGYLDSDSPVYLELALEGETPRGRPPKIPEPVDPLATMPTQEPGRTAEAIRRALPELLKLDRYESRAAARRDRAICEITKRRFIK